MSSSPRCLQVRDWAKAVLKEKNLDEGMAAAAAKRLEEEQVTGELLIGVTAEALASDYTMKRGPANLLVKHGRKRIPGGGLSRLEGCLAVTGKVREDDLSAAEFIQELANAKPQDLGEGCLGAWGGRSLLSAPLLQVCRSSTSRSPCPWSPTARAG